MKRKLLFVTALIASFGLGDAFASSPRVSALNGIQLQFASRAIADFGATGTNGIDSAILPGALNYDDPENIFYNPALLNTYKNWAIMQARGDSAAAAAATAGGNLLDGGFFKEGGNFVYGFYFGRNVVFSDDANAIFADESGAATANEVANDPIELFFAGDSGVQWGASLTFLNGSTEADSTGTTAGSAKFIKLNGGVNVAGAEIFLDLGLLGEASDHSTFAAGGPFEYEVQSYITLGAKYDLMDWKLFFSYLTYEAETGTAGDTEKRTDEDSALVLGAGRTYDVAEGVKVITGIGYNMSESSDDLSTTDANNEKWEDTYFPIHIGVEAVATSWLTLRAGTKYTLLRRIEQTGGTSNDTEKTVNRGGHLVEPQVGGTLTFGNLTADFLYEQGFNHDAAGEDINNIGRVAISYLW